MPSIADPANGSSAILFMDAIMHHTLKFVAFSGKDQGDIDEIISLKVLSQPTAFSE
jgi:hypothetical protein